jgi:glutathione synthase/RimK-type ligase-like ATP-grasp enzyme
MLHFPSLRALYCAMLIFEAVTWVPRTVIGLRKVELVAEAFSKGVVWKARKGEKGKSENRTEKVKEFEEMKEKEAASSTEVRLPEGGYDSAWYGCQ